MTYTGILFSRILIHTGYPFGNRRSVPVYKLTSTYNEYLCRWGCEHKFTATLNWLEDNGYISIRRNIRKRGSYDRTDFIYVTEKGYSIADKYVR